MPNLDHIARHAEGPHHEPDGLGAQHVAVGAAGALFFVFLLSVMVWAVAQVIRG